MPDNTILNPGSGGDTMSTEDIGGIKMPRSKAVIGGHGVDGGDVSLTNPMPVTTDTVTVKKLYDVATTGVGTEYGYIGTAPLGTASSAAAWTIKQTTFSNGSPVAALWSSATAIWDNRATTLYS